MWPKNEKHLKKKKKRFREMFLHQSLENNNDNGTKSYTCYSTAIINDNLTGLNANTEIRDFGSNLVAPKAHQLAGSNTTP